MTLAAEAPLPDAGSLVLVLAAASGGAILSRLHSRIILPTVVLEIVLGILIGPEGFGWAEVDSHIDFLSQLGLVFLFFFAGLELVEHRVARRSLVRGTVGWAISLAHRLRRRSRAALGGLDAEAWLLGVALATTALGTLVPILGDAGLLPTPLGSAVLGTGVAGEFWPIVVISIFLTGAYGAVTETLLLLGFGAVVLLAATAALRARPPRVVGVLQQTVHTTGQAAVRLSVLVLAALVFLAIEVGFDFVLGAFAGGLVVGLALSTAGGRPGAHAARGDRLRVPDPDLLRRHRDDLRSRQPAHADRPRPRGALPRAASSSPAARRPCSGCEIWAPRQTVGLALFGATGLPLIVAIVGIGIDRGAIARRRRQRRSSARG